MNERLQQRNFYGLLVFYSILFVGEQNVIQEKNCMTMNAVIILLTHFDYFSSYFALFFIQFPISNEEIKFGLFLFHLIRCAQT